MEEPEVWKEVAEFPGYRVSSLGRVIGRRGWILRATKVEGYFRVHTCMEGKRRVVGVHLLVLLAFVGPRPEGCVCRHIDGNPSNNRVENLAWGTWMENSNDMLIHRTGMIGEKCHLSKLTEKQVLEIRSRRGTSTHGELAKEYGMSRAGIKDIQLGRCWRYLLPPYTIQHTDN